MAAGAWWRGGGGGVWFVLTRFACLANATAALEETKPTLLLRRITLLPGNVIIWRRVCAQPVYRPVSGLNWRRLLDQGGNDRRQARRASGAWRCLDE